MNLISYAFWGFAGIVFCVYMIVPQNKKWMVLLLASYYFFLTYGYKPVIYLLLTTGSSYFGARYIERQKTKWKKKLIFWICLIFNIGLMLALKQGIIFTDFIITKMPYTLQKISLELLFVPLGISYYTLKVAAYLIDVYYGRAAASKHLFKFALYVSFFPEIIQGPIEKYQNINSQFDNPEKMDYRLFRNALYRILWGMVKKLVFSQKIGEMIPAAFAASSLLSGYQILIGTMFYSMQLYADFTGYMDIMQGTAELFGIHISKNFNCPYFSESMEAFWHRWHMTMGGWFREYIFYPVSTSKIMKSFSRICRKRLGNTQGKKIPIYIAVFVTWFGTGLWHGGSANWILWGLLNGFLILLEIQFKEFNDTFYKKCRLDKNFILLKICRVIRTFTLVSFLRIFSRSDSLESAFHMVAAIFTRFFEKPVFYYWEAGAFSLAMLGCTAIIIGDLIEMNSNIRKKINEMPCVFRWMIAYAGISLIIMFQGSATEFLYAHF